MKDYMKYFCESLRKPAIKIIIFFKKMKLCYICKENFDNKYATD